MTRPFAVYLDENIDHGLIDYLRLRSYDVAHAHFRGMERATDDEQLAFAASEDRFLLTHNRKHFQPLHLLYRSTGR